MKKVWEKYQPIVEIVVLEKLHMLSKKIENRLGMITESEMNIMDVDEYAIPKFGVMFGTNLCASFDKVEKDKKLELLRLIIENKKIWILDEPLSNLDDESIDVISQTFEDHCSKEGSIIFSSHQESEINVTEEILL